jgi:hypothetical protein
VAQDFLVGAAGVFQGVSEDRQAFEGAVGIDGLGEGDNVGGLPSGGDGYGAAWERAEYISEQFALSAWSIAVNHRSTAGSSYSFRPIKNRLIAEVVRRFESTRILGSARCPLARSPFL